MSSAAPLHASEKASRALSWGVWCCLLGLIIVAVIPMRVAESDIWFHFRNAHELFVTHALPRMDTYTFTASGVPLINHEWMSELPYYAGFRAWGLQGMVAVNIAVLWLILGASFYLACYRGAHCGDAALLTVLAFILGLSSSGPRMHNFGYICMVALLIALERFQQTGRGLWVLPPLFAIWVNLHGTWLFGFVFAAIYLAGGLLYEDQGRVIAERWPPGKVRKLLFAMGVSAGALFLNPYGYKLVLYPFDLIFRQGANVSNVVEWQSVNFNDFWGGAALVMLLLVLAAALSNEHWTMRDVLMLVLVLYLSLKHVRFLQLAGIVLIPILATKIRIWPSFHFRSKSNFGFQLAAASMILTAAFFSYPSEGRLRTKIEHSFPSGALRYMQENNVSGKIFNDYDFGGFIEWTAPEVKTYADGRTDIFVYTGVLTDYLKARNIEEPFEVLDKYHIDNVLYRPRTPLAYVLDHSSQWQLAYADSVARLYRRVKDGAVEP